MTFQERRDKFIEEVKLLGEKHKIGLVGTCENEGIYGEITIVDMENAEASGWNKVEDRMWNFE